MFLCLPGSFLGGLRIGHKISVWKASLLSAGPLVWARGRQLSTRGSGSSAARSAFT